MNSNSIQGQISECNKIVTSPKSEFIIRKIMYCKKVSQVPCTAASSEPPSETRTYPTWGSNLMVKDNPNDTFIDKMTSNTNSILHQSLDYVEDFIIEYNTDVANKTPAQINHQEINTLYETKQDLDENEEDEDDENMNMRSEEIHSDDHVVDYLKQLEEYRTNQKIKRSALESPARAGIPVTTPKSSPIPKRPRKTISFHYDLPQFESIEQRSDEQINSVEDSDEEYKEWETRLRHLQEVLERSLQDIDSRKSNKEDL